MEGSVSTIGETLAESGRTISTEMTTISWNQAIPSHLNIAIVAAKTGIVSGIGNAIIQISGIHKK